MYCCLPSRIFTIRVQDQYLKHIYKLRIPQKRFLKYTRRINFKFERLYKLIRVNIKAQVKTAVAAVTAKTAVEAVTTVAAVAALTAKDVTNDQ